MLKRNFNYRDFYLKYDLSGEINIGTGIVKVHDIFDQLPEFMKQADCLFIDPPCSHGNFKSFYTKADKQIRMDITSFNNRLFELIDEIKPNRIFIEVFKSNKDIIEKYLDHRYKNISVHKSFYYSKESNTCWILQANNDDIYYDIPYLDEEKVIEYICKNVEFNCIGDLCMGKGLVGFYANKYNKKFVGTELNNKRLACLIEHINLNKIIVR